MLRLVLIAGFVLPILLATDWPTYRGPGAGGVGQGSAPLSWSGTLGSTAGRNIKWQAPIAGLGHSSPVIIGNRLFITTAVSSAGKAPLKIGLYGSGDSADDNAEQEWVLYCLDKRTGKVMWRQTAYKGKPKAARHTKATHANTTVATDGKRVVALFGSEGLYSYTIDGKLEWQKEFGTLDMAPSDDRSLSWGFASSPVLYEGVVVVQSDSKKDSFLAAFAADTGRELWRVPRSAVSVCSWATPGIFKTGGRTQIVTNGFPYIVGYDFKTGKELWRLKSEGDIPVPTPFMAHGLIYVANAHGGKAPLYAIRPDASGDITPAAGSRVSAGLAWSEDRNGSYLQTPVVYGDLIYASTGQGIFKAYEARSGRKLYEERLGTGGSFTSSPIAADGKVYVSNEDGRTFVIKAGPKFELLANNDLGEPILSTPAISEGVMFIRTPANVVAISE
ncbi:MAG TPA: PQQ-binding-like beta-propeller repeat protein [Bryobacteraceae bacterium]|nr:PQQ-binding-like beta-propeller repeat protein [Bryobacteraceae bacterium]